MLGRPIHSLTICTFGASGITMLPTTLKSSTGAKAVDIGPAGAGDGSCVGTPVGAGASAALGDADGLPVGAALGAAEGCWVGFSVGA